MARGVEGVIRNILILRSIRNFVKFPLNFAKISHKFEFRASQNFRETQNFLNFAKFSRKHENENFRSHPNPDSIPSSQYCN